MIKENIYYLINIRKIKKMSLNLDENDIHKGEIDGDESYVSFTE